MTRPCPWCGAPIPRATVRGLTQVPAPAPCCGRPVRQSLLQVLFVVVLLLPLVALALGASKLAFERLGQVASVVVLLGGGAVAIFVQKYVPVVHGPARAAAR